MMVLWHHTFTLEDDLACCAAGDADDADSGHSVTCGAVGVRYLHPPHEVLGSDDVALPHC